MGWCFARLYDLASAKIEAGGLRAWREQLLALADGDVVEVGAGTGSNLRHYPPRVTRVRATEPDRHMRARLRARVAALGDPRIEIVDAPAEHLPFADASADTVVGTLVFCTVADPAAGLAECRRVLKPGGAFLFIEHVQHDEPGLQRWQRRLEPLWRWCAGGCHLTRPTGASIRAAGFEIETLHAERMPKSPRILPTIRGVARKR